MSSEESLAEKVWKIFKELVFSQVLLGIVFFTSGLLLTAISFLLYITVRPFSPTFYRKINYYVSYSLTSQIVFLAEWWSESNCQLFIEPEHGKNYFGKEHAILSFNHSYEIDWTVGMLVSDRFGILGNARAYIKKILVYVPVLGWTWKFQEYVLLERNWEQDKINLGRQLKNLSNYPDPIWLTLFPEGTRFTPKKHIASMEVARQKGLPELKHHLLPRTKGFVASLPHLREKIPALYDFLLVVDPKSKNKLTTHNMLRGRKVNSKLMIRRYPLSEIPKDEKKAANWLHKIYQEKDEYFDNFLRTGEFLTKEQKDLPQFRNFEYVDVPRRSYSLINFSSWALVILVPLIWYLYTIVIFGNYFALVIIFSVIVAVNVIWKKMLDFTNIDRVSSYGQ